MDDPLQKALGSLHQSITKRSRKSAAITSNDEEDKLFKTQSPDPSPRDQQDLMAFPFFSLEKHKRTKPIEYEQGVLRLKLMARQK